MQTTILKTPEELLENYITEYNTRRNNGEPSYLIGNCYALFYLNKYYTPEKKGKFYIDALFIIMEKAKELSEAFMAQHSIYTNADFQSYNKSFEPYFNLFRIMAHKAAPYLKEEEILELLQYYSPIYDIKWQHREHIFDKNIFNLIFNASQFLYFVAVYLKHQPLSLKLRGALIQFKEMFADTEQKYFATLTDKIITKKGNIHNSYFPAEKKKKELSAELITYDRKFEWLRAHPLDFIPDKDQFFLLLAYLSKINYFNLPSISPKVEALIQQIDPIIYEAFVLDLLQEIKKEGNKRSGWFIGHKVVAFQAIAWLILRLETPNRFSILTNLIERCFTKIPRVGPTSRILGDLLLKILYESEGLEELGTLLNLKPKAKYPVFKQALNAAIKKAVRFSGLNPKDIEDLFIDDFGLKNGKVVAQFGKFRSEIIVEHYDKVQLKWFKPDGKTQKSIPAAVKKEFPNELKLWKAKQKDIKKALSTQKYRIEGFWRIGKKWPYDKWKKYLLDHELLQLITKNLIWTFTIQAQSYSGIWSNGNLRTVNGSQIPNLESAIVTLWHPCQATETEVQSWRTYFLEKELRQAFKQAFREIYLVTEAEITTSTYSNRFLNHIVRHHKFAALAKQRFWTYNNVYAQHAPYLNYPEHNMQVTFDLMNNYNFATTGRVHFRDITQNQAIQMEEVPTILFSESMRDVDLFVGVCSIGIEEEETVLGTHRTYWRHYSQAPLSELAKTRKAVLQSIIPKLKIKDQCNVGEKYLIVKGTIRTYKIHFGSGNILMEPNDQYLCIVPDRSKKDAEPRLFLPFEDDQTLSIILSKAFLLAEDDKIKDEVILRQLKRY